METFSRKIEGAVDLCYGGKTAAKPPFLDAAMAAVTGSLAHRHAAFILSVTMCANIDRAQKAKNRRTLPEPRPSIAIGLKNAG